MTTRPPRTPVQARAVATEPRAGHRPAVSTWQHSTGRAGQRRGHVTDLLDNPHVQRVGAQHPRRDRPDHARGRADSTRRSRLPHRAGQPRAVPRPAAARSGAREGRAGGGVADHVPRPGRLQGDQRHPRAQHRRRAAGAGRRAAALSSSGPRTPWPASAATSSPSCRRLDRTPPMLAERIADALQQPFVFGSHRVHVSASIGIAASDETDATTPSSCCATPTWRCTRPRRAGTSGVRRLRPHDAREPGGAPPDGGRSPLGARDRASSSSTTSR